MQQHYLDPQVFIRSMATRGSLGGLPRVASRAVRVLDASGKDIVLVETVGVGQTEVDVMKIADSVVVVLVPEAGDAVQTLKAGLMEIADVFAVNKADREGSGRMVATLRNTLTFSNKLDWWRVPVVPTQATKGEGVEKLWDTIQEHRTAMEKNSILAERRRERQRHEFFQTVEEWVGDRLSALVKSDGELGDLMKKIEEGATDPHSAAIDVLRSGTLLRHWLSLVEKKE